MRQPDPEWQTLANEPFARWIDVHQLQYNADRIRRLIALRQDVPTEGAIDVEIGSNRGRFLKGLCMARPDAHVFGIEVKKGLCQIAARRLARHGLDNGHVVFGDAKLAIPILFGPNRLQGVYVLFPDPWWKKRHAKRRVVDDAFLGLIHDHLAPGGWFVLMTDVQAYHDHVRDLLDDMADRFEAVPREAIEGQGDWHLTTRERHCSEDGVPIWRLFVKKRPSETAD